jgi:hypothetical protein
MAKWYRKKIGIVNVLSMGVINGLIAFLSIFSIASNAETEKWHQEPMKFFIGRMTFLVLASLIMTGALAVLNIIYNLIYSMDRGKRAWYTNVGQILFWSLLATVVIGVLGTLLMLG